MVNPKGPSIADCLGSRTQPHLKKDLAHLLISVCFALNKSNICGCGYAKQMNTMDSVHMAESVAL